MSTLAVDNVKPSAGGTAANLPLGLAKMWVRLNGSGTLLAVKSMNVASLTDVGVGTYTINLTSTMLSANYPGLATTGANWHSICASAAAGTATLATSDSTHTNADDAAAQASLYGDLA